MKPITNLSARLILLCVLFAGSVSVIVGPGARGQNQDNEKPSGLQFRVSEGGPEKQPQPAPTPHRPTPSSLPSAVLQALLRRLPAIKASSEDAKGFAMRDRFHRALPPPRAGKTINQTFPALDSGAPPDQTSSGDLEIVRFAPEGEVPLAPHLSITFSQPMVAVTSNEDLSAAPIPVKLSPLPKGKWRWVGAKTMLFQPADRFPMATNYTVEIPAGIRSIGGAQLKETKRMRFATPPLKLSSIYPSGDSARRNPIFFAEFDQKIDPEAVLKFIHLLSGFREWPLRMATVEEIKGDEDVRKMAAGAENGRWLAFRAAGSGVDLLPPDTRFTISLSAGAPSAEGSRAPVGEQKHSFSTYGPLRVVDYFCDQKGKRVDCGLFANWQVEFSNELPSDFDRSLVKIEPEPAGLIVENRNYIKGLLIAGQPRPRTSYKVKLDASIKDVYGQTLGEDVVLNFSSGKAPLGLAVPGGTMTVLDPAGPRRMPIYSVNHESLKVSLYAVEPNDWGRFMAEMRDRYNYDRNRQAPPPFPQIGRRVFSEVIKINARPDEFTETPIDLTPALKGGFGHALLVVEPTANVTTPAGPQLQVSWIQSTEIGLDAFVDQTRMEAWATSLKDGKPVEGVDFSLIEDTPSGKAIDGVSSRSGVDGLAKLGLPSSEVRKVLIARKGNDFALLPENKGWWGEGSNWKKTPLNDSLAWHVFDDRGIYRPGEEVHVKGWVRRIGAGPGGDVRSAGSLVKQIFYTLKDSRDAQISEGKLLLNLLGGFDAVFKLPATASLGQARLKILAEGIEEKIEGREHQHNFQIQEFRRPEFEVKATASEGPHFVGGHAELTVSANYYAGGALPNAGVGWFVNSTPMNYTPPNHGDFTFGKWFPWWRTPDYERGDSEEFTGRTDASGKHRLRIDFDAVNPPRPHYVNAQARVEDVNRQNLSAETGFIVHPAELYVGLRSPRTFVQQGEQLAIESIVSDIDGKLIANREIKMRAVRLDWLFEKGQWVEREIDPQDCVVKSATAAVICRFQTKEGGRHRVRASVIDDKERRNESELTLWVAGGKRPPQNNLAKEDVELIPNNKEYQPGETAEILIQSPFAPAEGLMTVRRSGLVSSERFTVDSTSHTLRIPIKDGYLPNIHVQVDLVGAAERTDEEGKSQAQLPKRPAFASGELNLPISLATRRLTVKAEPRNKTLEPGGSTVVDVEVRDADGKPARNCEVALVVVDEAVLALTDYKLADPLKSFYSEREAGVHDYHLRNDVLLIKPDDLIGQIERSEDRFQLFARKGAGGGGADALAMASSSVENVLISAGIAESQIRTRLNFNALATFAAAVPTDLNGRAVVRIKLPDNLTRYRVMVVVAAGGKQFGTAESAITAKLPLMVRPSAPRFLNFGDKFELPVVVQNQTGKPMQVDLVLRASNAELTAGAGRRVTVPANDRVEVRFPATAVKPGTARFQIAAVSGRYTDASEISLPVWTPATTEAFATYGEIDAGAIAQPVKTPSDAIKEFGGLEITTSSTQLQALTDAVLYLTKYPYDCAEQVSSRILAIAALKDVLAAFDAKGLPPPEELVASVNRDLKRLESLQNGKGGFGFWRSGESDDWPFLSIHVAHALQRAKEKGFDVNPNMLEFSQRYLKEIETHIPGWYGADVKRSLIAYSLYVRHRFGDRDAIKARLQIELAGGVEKFSLEALGWLLPVLSGDERSKAEVAAIRRHLNNRAEEATGTAHFTASYQDGAYLLLHSDRRADGVILEALIGDDPKNDLIPKIVRGLLAHRKQGRWENTQENAFVLLALDRYFATYEKTTPDFVARAWLGEAFAGGQVFKGRSTNSRQLQIPMSYLMKQGDARNLTLSKEGAGRLYYRIGMQYAPANLQLKPADYGFTVTRSYEAIGDPNDVRREEDGTWRIKAGAQVRVRLTLATSARRYHVALVDPLPAGFETMNPELATTGDIPPDPKDQEAGRWSRWSNWFDHQNLRDERVEAFTSLLWEGVYSYSYVVRATTPGMFIAPPPKAEEMYHPETFGRGASERVVIE